MRVTAHLWGSSTQRTPSPRFLLLLLCTALALSQQRFAVVRAAAICTKTCLDCREYKQTSICIQCISDKYITDYITRQCNIRPSYVPCSVPHCTTCVLNGPKYCYMCDDGYQQKDEDLQCELLPTTTTTSTTTTTTTSTTPVPTSSTKPGPTGSPTATPTSTTTTSTTTTTTTSTSTTTTTTTSTALCNVLWCSKCDYNDGSVCTECYEGFKWKKSNKCEPTKSCYVDGCLECDAMDSSVCLSCRKGYTLESPSSCRNNVLTSAAYASPRLCVSFVVIMTLLPVFIASLL